MAGQPPTCNIHYKNREVSVGVLKKKSTDRNRTSCQVLTILTRRDLISIERISMRERIRAIGCVFLRGQTMSSGLVQEMLFLTVLRPYIVCQH